MSHDEQRAPDQGARRGLFRRIVDWLMWDGEDEHDVSAQEASARFQPRVCPPPPRRDVDSIDWDAFAEGRPQENETFEAMPETEARTVALDDDESGFAFASVEEESPQPVSVGGSLRIQPPSTADVMASIQWDR